jgi:hypothetical protein
MAARAADIVIFTVGVLEPACQVPASAARAPQPVNIGPPTASPQAPGPVTPPAQGAAHAAEPRKALAPGSGYVVAVLAVAVLAIAAWRYRRRGGA